MLLDTRDGEHPIPRRANNVFLPPSHIFFISDKIIQTDYSGGFRLLLVTITGCLPLLADVTLTPDGHGCCLTVLVQVIRFLS